MEYIAHYGVKHRSGRYPWGSGKKNQNKDNASSQKSNFKNFVKEYRSFSKHPNSFYQKRFGTTLTNEFLDKNLKIIENKYDAVIKANRPFGKQLSKALDASKKYGKNSQQYKKEKKLADKLRKEAQKASDELEQVFVENGKKFLEEKLGSYSTKGNILDAFYDDSRNTYRFNRMSKERVKEIYNSYSR